MDDLEKRLYIRLTHLYSMLAKYNKHDKLKHNYNWRIQAIETQIDALEELRDNEEDNWLECYKEDCEESGIYE